MASVPIKIPSVGESVTEGILARWLKPDGAAVKKGEPLFELETDKASQEITAEIDGTLAIDVQEGETVEVGTSVGRLDPDAAPRAQSAGSPRNREPRPSTEPATPASPTVAKAAPVEAKSSGDRDGARPGDPPSPAVRRIATEEGVDLAEVEGTGHGGRVTKGDVVAHLESRQPASEPASNQEPRTTPAPAAHPRPGDFARQTRQRMSGIRQKIAQRLVEAQQTAAILTTFNEADMSRVMDLRARYKESFKEAHGIGLGFMSFFIKAAIEALKAFPNVNGRIEGNEIVINHYFDIGVAVSTERGLMVPIIREADHLSFAEIEKTIADYAKKARDNAIAVADLQGGTFTITNGGIFGSLLSTPILNPPQSGILGMHSIQKRPMVVDDQIVIRPMMYLALSYDHRIIDGREAVSFLVKIKQCIENPERMMLGL